MCTKNLHLKKSIVAAEAQCFLLCSCSVCYMSCILLCTYSMTSQWTMLQRIFYYSRVQLKAHSSKHRKHRLFLCSLCDQTFKSIRQMNRHNKRFHHKQNNGDCNNGKVQAGNHSNAFVSENSVNPKSIAKREFPCEICKR